MQLCDSSHLIKSTNVSPNADLGRMDGIRRWFT